ncbi:MAG: DUF1893 domain-containing protein [Muribaculaceae bacterium]|nr:DUF1893 domain-containing protein [Muribaculaceae bacterium]
MGIDLRHIITESDRYNFHSHSQFCDGRDSMETIAAEAEKEGFVVWGFSPHGPITVESPCNMAESDMEAYHTETRKVSAAHPDMKILCGLEADYISPTEGPSQMKLKYPWLDYLIGSVHFVPTQSGVPVDIDGSPARFAERLESEFGGDLEYVVRTFWKQTADMIARGGFDIIGHIDKVALNASSVKPEIEMTSWYRSMADEVIDLAISSGKAVEINTKQRLSAGRFFPHPRYWARLSRAGVLMPINSDTHYAARADESRLAASRLLKAITALDSDSGLTLAIVRADGALETFRRRGVTDLWNMVSMRPETMLGATVADKVIGRGAAALLVAGGVSQVYGEIMSRPALEMFSRFPAIKVDYGTVVDGILNRAGDGSCPVEALTAGVSDVGECLNLIEKFVNNQD